MTELNRHDPGTFCWVDLATDDTEGAKRFYSGLFDWKFEDMPAGTGIYSMAFREGKEVAALYHMMEDERVKGVKPYWKAYVSVMSADVVARKAKDLGGFILAPPIDVFDAGRMAIIRDPSGAVLALWEPRCHIGTRLSGEPGTFCWNELNTRDVEAAGSFYTRLFAWEQRRMGSGPSAYSVFQLNGSDRAGMMLMPPECGPDAYPSWLTYFLVNDCDRSAEKGTGLGAKILKPATDIKGVGRFAVLQDPQGAVLALFKPGPV